MPDGAVPANALAVADRVRWEDVDLVGVMRSSAYPRLIDLAEAELLRAAGLPYPATAERLGVWLVRRALHLEYHAPARFDAPLTVRAWVGRVGTTSLTLHVAVASGDGATVHATGHAVVVTTGMDLAKRAVPAALLAALAPYRDAHASG